MTELAISPPARRSRPSSPSTETYCHYPVGWGVVVLITTAPPGLLLFLQPPPSRSLEQRKLEGEETETRIQAAPPAFSRPSPLCPVRRSCFVSSGGCCSNLSPGQQHQHLCSACRSPNAELVVSSGGCCSSLPQSLAPPQDPSTTFVAEPGRWLGNLAEEGLTLSRS